MPLKIIYNVLLPLLLGAFLYISFRSTTIRMFDWFEFIGIEQFTNLIRISFHPIKSSLPTWIYYSLPDGLWMYSFSSVYLLIWRKEIGNGKYWLLIPLITGCLFEILQGLKLFEGTFDPIDLSLCLLALMLSIITNFYIQKNEKQKQIF